MTTRLIATMTAALVAAGLLAAAAQATPAPQPVPPCTNTHLVASYRATDAGMSHQYGRIVLRNVSETACSIRGYGGLSYVGGGTGRQIGAAATRTPGKVRTVVVRPGRRVISEVAATDAAPYPRRTCRPAHVDGFRVYLPDETRAQFVAHPTTGCRSHRVHLLSHRGYRRP